MLKNSITITRVAGIPIKIHVSFLIILPFFSWVIASNINQIANMAGVDPAVIGLNPLIIGLILAIMLFISVTFHEISHSLVARTKGIEINSITLMLLGGVAQMDDDFQEPKAEALMAFAGPLFSLVFGGLLLFIIRPIITGLNADLSLMVYYLGYINIFLAIFNLLPAFPSDGGRILRSLLALKTSHYKATKIATAVGKGFALLMGFYGFLYGQIILMLIAFFIYIGASQEKETSLMRDVFGPFKVKDLMTEKVITVREDIKISELLDKMLKEKHSGYPVVDSAGNLTGCVTLEDIREISEQNKELKEVEEIMACNIISVKPEDELFEAFKKMSQAEIGRLMVIEDGELVGILTRSDIMKAHQLKIIKDKQNNS
ncbi:MAG: M50 family metallopeptidase [Halarsenatibacteraceae bacterium]